MVGGRTPVGPQILNNMKRAAYIILVKDKRTGVISGYVEHSFSMGLDPTRVNLNRVTETNYGKKGAERFVRTKGAQWCRKTVDRMNREHSNVEAKYFRVGSKNCPVIIDWREINQMAQRTMKYDKYKWRNLPFKIKENVNF